MNLLQGSNGKKLAAASPGWMPPGLSLISKHSRNSCRNEANEWKEPASAQSYERAIG
jgi:hypothetical protein